MTEDDRDVKFFEREAPQSYAPVKPETVIEEASLDLPLLHPSAQNTNNRFIRAIRRVKGSKLYKAQYTAASPYGIYNGRPIIGEVTRINGGIYLGAVEQEAIVVDEKYGALAGFFAELAKRSELGTTKHKEYDLIRDILQLVIETFRFNPPAVKEISKEQGVEHDGKVVLDIFLEAGVGVSRHRALAAGFLIEKLRDQGFLRGAVAIDNRMKRDDADDEKLIYTASSGELVTFTPRAHV